MLPAMAEVRSRAEIANAAFLLFTATLIILVDVRVPTFDIVADVVGGVLVAVAALRINAAITGADGLRAVLVVLAILALPVTILETLAPSPTTGFLALLGLTQLGGTIVLARLLSEALRVTEPALAATWRTAFQLVIWLALVPVVIGYVLGAITGPTTFESPLVILVLVVLVVPLLAVLQALWRTAQEPQSASAGAAPDTPSVV